MERKKFKGLTLTTAAATLKAMLVFVDHPKNDELVISDDLVQRIQKELTLNETYDGTRLVGISFSPGEDEIVQQFLKLAESCYTEFATVVRIVSSTLPKK